MPLGLGSHATPPKGAAASLSVDARLMNLKRLRKLCSAKGAERTPDDILRLCEVTASLCHFFRTMPLTMSKEVCRCVELELFGKGEVVFRQGDVGQKFYVIVQGRLDVLVRESSKKRGGAPGPNDAGDGGARTDSHTLASTANIINNHGGSGVKQENKLTQRDIAGASVVATLCRGDTFGEIALVKDGLRTATIFTKTKTELLVLHKDDFQRILHSLYGTSIDDRLNYLERLHALTHASENEVKDFAHFLCVAAHQEGTVFYPEKDNRLHFIVEGEAKLRLDHAQYGTPVDIVKTITAPGASGFANANGPREWRYAMKETFYDSVTISRLGPGNCFGECSVFPHLRREGRVVEALTEVKLYFVAQADLQHNTEASVLSALKSEAEFKAEYYDGRYRQLMASREMHGVQKRKHGGGRKQKTSGGGAGGAGTSGGGASGAAGDSGASAGGDESASSGGAGESRVVASGAEEHKPEEIVTQEELNRQEENNIRFLETLKLAGRREGIRLAQMQAQAQRSPIDHEKVNAW
ncbi:hypothetical protein PPROV_000410000 [Pycnococcus provasolii]|uniref:Cyclic nucleotide-binding domain-containing protein n=1 Tax=Pycnococcus provasolii TaxID=41880 RepID=A0A830HEZ7_9CHLO|nr:hypothetical protein PPROV_000410000 [Pycnococcus provasolii]